MSKETEVKKFMKLRTSAIKRRDEALKQGNENKAALAQRVIDNCDMKIWELEK